ncbi:MAG: type II secretion system F family protein [Actinomycetes bacterium]
MGLLVGLLAGFGLLLVWQSVGPGPRPRRRSALARPSWRARTADMIAAAGVEAVTPMGLLAACSGAGVVSGLALLGLSGSLVLAAAFAMIATYTPVGILRQRARGRRAELRELWPEVTDNLASAVRAGLSLPESLGQVGIRGPEPLRRAFVLFAEDYRATGRFGDSLDALKERLADPVGDRICESLRMAREVGGTDLGRLLRTLSGFLREEARTRAELEARQSWTVNAARLAVAAPWILLLMFSLRPEAVAAYDSPAGLVVVAVGAGICVLAYRLMIRLGRLPEEERVLR